jgi:hypothetical protein
LIHLRHRRGPLANPQRARLLSNRKPLHGDNTRLKAVGFIHRLKASLNRHVHYDENHPCSRASGVLSGAQIRSLKIGDCCVIDGVFEPVEEADDGLQSARFRAAAGLMPEAVATITEQVRIRGLRWFARSGLIERDDVCEMRALTPLSVP